MNTLLALMASMALQSPGPATIQELSQITSDAAICREIGYDVDTAPLETWLKAIVRAEPGLTYDTAVVIFNSRMQSQEEAMNRSMDAITTRAAHNASIDAHVAVCEQFLVAYPRMVTRLPTTNTTIAMFKQYGVDRFPE